MRCPGSLDGSPAAAPTGLKPHCLPSRDVLVQQRSNVVVHVLYGHHDAPSRGQPDAAAAGVREFVNRDTQSFLVLYIHCTLCAGT